MISEYRLYESEVRRHGRLRLAAYDGKPLKTKNPAPFGPDDVVMDHVGNIVRMPPVPQKECFGSIAAVLRHGAPSTKGKSGKILINRCGNCSIMAACHKVVLHRISANPGIRAAVLDWSAVAQQARAPIFKFTGRARKPWERVLAAITNRGRFQSVNDDVVRQFRKGEIERAVAQKEAARRKDAERKRASRAQARVHGIILPEARRTGEKAMAERHNLLTAAVAKKKRPHFLRHCSAQTTENTANVWLARELLKEVGVQPTLGKIADWLIANGLAGGLGRASLRARIAKSDLPRIARLEEGGLRAVWPPFNMELAIAANAVDVILPPTAP